jgi:hypothetical protein
LLQISTLPATEKAADHYQIYEILGRSDVEVTLNVYDHPETENFRGTSGGSSRSVVTRCYEIGIGGAVNYCKQTKMEPTTRVELVTCRLRNSSAPRKLLKDLGCISTLWGIVKRFGRKMCNTLCNGSENG